MTIKSEPSIRWTVFCDYPGCDTKASLFTSTIQEFSNDGIYKIIRVGWEVIEEKHFCLTHSNLVHTVMESLRHENN